MDQNDFLRLMTTQLTTQDPFNPVDNTQMVAQMAQFSQVAGIAEINSSLKTLVSSLGAGRINDAASWIGRTVLAEADVAAPLKDGSYAGEAAIPKDADTVRVAYVGAGGAILHEETHGATSAGTLPFSWNGKNADGETIATGPVKIVVTAKAGTETLTTPTATWTVVGGIQSPATGGSTKLLTGLGALSPDDALRLA
jgi:flagellar basal-body rod modification protein FlgD